MTLIMWIGIAVCISQSAILSGLNLAYFSVNKMLLELEASRKNKYANRVLAMRKDANFLLVTILWGNVAINVLLALLSGSVLTGVMAFLFSTVIITIIGEILPQAYFSRNALKMGYYLAPVLWSYQFILYPVAKPTALVLDWWLGEEAINYLREKDIRELIKMHVMSSESDVDRVEGRGALNFLAIDDLPLSAEGEIIDPESIIQCEFSGNKPVFPDIEPSYNDEFLKKIQRSHKKWVIILDENKEPRTVLNADRFIREILFNKENFHPYSHCHRPIIVRDSKTRLGDTIPRLKVHPEHKEDDVIDEDIILLWDEQKRVITGSDILGRLLRGIVQNEAMRFKMIS